LVSSGRSLDNRKKVEAEVIPYRDGKRNGEPKSGKETEAANRKKDTGLNNTASSQS
jgi:hypothetical protein